MSGRDGFERDILAHPDAVDLRLIFADYLDDHDEAERAELIRVQCHLADLPVDDQRREALVDRGQTLLALHARAWTPELYNGVTAPVFRRGFVEELTMSAATFLWRAAQLVQLMPLRRVRFARMERLVCDLASAPLLAQLAGLDLRPSLLWCDRLEALLSSPHLSGLRDLDVSSSWYGGDAVKTITRPRRLTSLRSLGLHGNSERDWWAPVPSFD